MKEKEENKQQQPASAEPQEVPKEHPTLQEVIREQATEGEASHSSRFTLKKILGGDILSTDAIRRQVWLILLITLFAIIYVANRYSCQQDIIQIDKLQRQLTDAKYKALTSTSKLTELSRQSNVLLQLKYNKDSVLKPANQPPFIIITPEDK